MASLDDRGTVSIWLVNEAPSGDEGGSQVRHGQVAPPYAAEDGPVCVFFWKEKQGSLRVLRRGREESVCNVGADSRALFSLLLTDNIILAGLSRWVLKCDQLFSLWRITL